MHQKEQRRDPLHTLGPRKRQTHYATPLRNDAHQNLPERTNCILTNIVPERVRTVTTATYKAVDTEFTISG